MDISYSYILSFLVLLLITHSTNTASLRSSLPDRRNSSIMNSEYSSPAIVLLQRHSQLPLVKRLRRWTRNEDNDEVEIPIDETILNPLNSTMAESTVSINNSDNISASNSTLNSSLVNFETVESIIEPSDSSTTFEVYSNEHTTINSTTNEQTASSIIEEVSQNINTNDSNLINNDATSLSTITTELININPIDSSAFIINITDVSRVTINDQNESLTDYQTKEAQIALIPIAFNQTTEESSNVSIITPIESDTIILPLDYTTVSYNNFTDDNQTNGWGVLFNDNTETISSNDSSTMIINNEFSVNTTKDLDISQKDAIAIGYDIDISTIENDTSINITTNSDVIPNDSTIIFSSKSLTIPICDHSCQCLKECPYGFEILNDTCLCDPLCKNYPCFGNDTCIVTEKGQRLCQPENGTEHDRPSRCYQPRDSGYHDINSRYHNRWYYNPDQDTCHLFVYRGLGGNENNFQTLHECHLECITCAPSPDRGECLGHINMWYYDYKKSDCSQFEYSGCKGNENKFLRKEQCINTCVNRILSL